MQRRPLDAVPPAAGRQAGTFTRAQAREAGWTTEQIRRRLSTGAWRRLAGRALVARDGTAGPTAPAWAVHLTWSDAVASHTTAARVHRMPVPDDPVLHALTPRRMKALADLRPHHLEVGPGDVLRLGPTGPRVTTPRRTALDCLRSLPVHDAERLLAWCVTREVLAPADLGSAVRQGLGRWGTPQLLRLLRASGGGALSAAERRFHDLMRRAGISGWVANARVRYADRVVAVVDVLFPAHRLVVEIDGWIAHGSADAFRTDRRRQNALVAAGYVVLRFTWADLTERPAGVVDEVRAALARAAAG